MQSFLHPMSLICAFGIDPSIPLCDTTGWASCVAYFPGVTRAVLGVTGALVKLTGILITKSFALPYFFFCAVDSTYASQEHNTKDPSTVERDMNTEVRYCAATPHTKILAIVLPDWDSRKFDPTGNTRAAELVRRAGKKSLLEVTVTGDLNKDVIHVSSLSLNDADLRR
jgi:hypothetical protein